MSGARWDESQDAPPAGGPAWGGGPPAGGDAAFPAALPPPRRRRTAVVAGALAGVVVLGGATATGLYLAGGLLGGGDQPEQHLPSTTVAMAKLDLNPSAGQKLDAIRFARKFPSGKGLREDGDPRQWVWEQTTKDVEGAPAWSAAEKWIGDRAAVAVVPGSAGDATPVAVVVLAVTDEKQAAADMASVRGAGATTKDGWLYVSDTAAHATAVATAATASPLVEKPLFVADMDRLGEDGVAAAWFDGPGLTTLAEGLAGAGTTLGQAGSALDGHGAVALRFDGADLELAGSVAGSAAAGSLAGAGTDVEKLPASTLAAVGAAGLGPALSENWAALADGLGAATGDEGALGEQASALLGIDVPGDLAVLLGTRTAVAVGPPAAAFGLPTVGVRVTTDAAKARPAVDRLTSSLGEGLPIGLEAQTFAAGYSIADDEDFAAALASSDGGLGANPIFEAAVPDAGKASVVAFADIAGLVAAYGDQLSAEDRAGLAALKSFGLAVVTSADGTSTLRMRLTTT